MTLAQIIVETKGPIDMYLNELSSIGSKHHCSLDPKAKYGYEHFSHYQVDSNPQSQARGQALIQDLTQLYFVVHAEYVSPTDKI